MERRKREYVFSPISPIKALEIATNVPAFERVKNFLIRVQRRRSSVIAPGNMIRAIVGDFSSKSERTVSASASVLAMAAKLCIAFSFVAVAVLVDAHILIKQPVLPLDASDGRTDGRKSGAIRNGDLKLDRLFARSLAGLAPP